MRPSEMDKAETLVYQFLALGTQNPGPVAVAHLVDDLITAGNELHVAVKKLLPDTRTKPIESVLDEWAYLAVVGPAAHGASANWRHACSLARVVWALMDALSGATSASRA
ncbi:MULTISPECIES: hypothetical protein [Streptomyces]|uniref:hypothetical protein n=1 Tax=Streptomyces TaxID=1883 RepID=UPI000A45DAE2|nr:hypothetical protein [Streptomyces virginiae]